MEILTVGTQLPSRGGQQIKVLRLLCPGIAAADEFLLLALHCLLKSKYIWKSVTLPKCFPNSSHSYAIFTILLYSYTTFFKYFFLIPMLSHSVVSDSAAPWTVACEAPLTMVFPRWKYWSGLLFPSPGDLPDPGIEPMSLMFPALSGRFFTNSTTWEAPFDT